MGILSGLNPEPIWIFFEEICKIPRLSKNEGKIRRYLLKFAAEHNLESKEDSAGNIVIIKPPSAGFENKKTVVLQSHMDMVGEKDSDNPHNWDIDAIIPYLDGEWVKARGTTLGADDGIGLASQLAILTDPYLKAGKIECLFTTDEESGMTGAYNISADFIEGRTLINLDSEDEGILFIGCAGGIDTVGEMKYGHMPVQPGMAGYKLSVTGLHGGHSGDEIHKGYGNSVKLMNRILRNLSDQFEIGLSSFNGGNLRNAIPREAFAEITVNKLTKDSVEKFVRDLQPVFHNEFGDLEKGLKIRIKETKPAEMVMDTRSRNKLIKLLSCCPHGVISWSKDMDDLVETSTNLASVGFSENQTVRIITTQRSSVESSKHDAAGMVEGCMKLANARVEHSSGYPGWKPNLRSEILGITNKSYRDLFGKDPQVRAIHAGLECGLFYEKFRGIDMISFGPSIKGAHTPEEKIEIRTVKMFWDLLIDVIKHIPEKNT